MTISSTVATTLTCLAMAGAPDSVAARDVPRVSTYPGLTNTPFPYRERQGGTRDEQRYRTLADLPLRWVEAGEIVGAEILVVEDEEILLHEAIGWSDKEAGVPIQRNSFFRLRSMTKPFTGTAAMLLIDSGKLSLQSKVSRYLPSWDNPRSGGITVEQLLTHRSGFKQSSWPAPASTFDGLVELANAVGSQGPALRPGARFSYSDANSFTLGALVELLSGVPLETFLQSQVLEPLDLRDTHTEFRPDAPWAARMIPTYRRDDGERWHKYWIPEDGKTFPYFRASGGLISTTLDYALMLHAWTEMHAKSDTHDDTGTGLISPRLVDRALHSHGSDEIAGYGFHWAIYQEEPLIFGHAGSDGTIGLSIPSRNLIALYFTQSRGTETTRIWLDEVLRLANRP